ncbi:MAG: AEC family transporter [Geminicoccaceae bacterium]
MLATFGALAPVFILIALGWLLGARGFPGAAFWPAAERLVYFVLFPALLFLTTAAADLGDLDLVSMAAALIVAIAAMAALTIGLRPLLRIGDAAFTSVFQGAIRCNTYVGLAAASALFGAIGLAVMGLVVFVVVTAVNLLSVVALIHYGRRAAGGRDVVASVARNPLILACLFGFGGNAAGIELPAVAYDTLDILARASLTLGLLCVGAGLELAHLGRARLAAAVTAALKLLAMPAATALACRMFGIDGLSAAAAVLFTACPISASSYVLARQLGGDASLLAGLITITTIAAVATMPLVLALLT